MSETATVPLNARIPKTLNNQLLVFQEEKGFNDKTSAVCLAIKNGVEMEKKVARLQRLYELVNLKTMYMLRRLTKERGEDFLKEIDAGFAVEQEDLEQMILEFGVLPDGD